MNLRQVIVAATLILLVAGSLYQPAAGSDFNVLLDGSQFRITWRINAMQNLTAFAKTITFPQNISSTLKGADLTAFTSALQNALQAKVTTVQISQPTISLSSNNVNATCSDHCAFQWLNATIAFDLHENPVQANGLGEYDMSWKAIRLEESSCWTPARFKLPFRTGSIHMTFNLAPRTGSVHKTRASTSLQISK